MADHAWLYVLHALYLTSDHLESLVTAYEAVENRMDDSVKEICEGDWPGDLCGVLSQARDSLSSWFAAYHDLPAASWTAALGSLAHQCHRVGAPLSESMSWTVVNRGALDWHCTMATLADRPSRIAASSA